ncbi:hypothetical protein V6N13_120884 [Hibiscus sabdariffa]|uniref:Uncharacterized protein n=1 Tax=Hibiscus sabdariffa TaxID=183260 RepID=A0ABR2E5J4_9ROSI
MKHQLLLAKRYFKLKFSCVIPYFHLCRPPKKPSKLPPTSVPVIQCCFSILDPKAPGYSDLSFPAPPPSTPDYCFFHRHLSPKIASVDCGCRARSYGTQCLSPDVSFESARFQKTAKANMVNKERKKVKVRAMATVSSTDSGCFSSELGDEDEETETLISNSRTFSDDSSFELDQSLADEDSPMEIKRNKNKVNGKKKKRLGSFGSKKYRRSSTENETPSPWRSSILKRTMVIPPCTAEEKVAESVAVVKKSEDPYERLQEIDAGNDNGEKDV